MYFVGVDLAWGSRNPSGVASLDADGRLVHLSAQTHDDSIEAAMAPYVTGPCVVAFDAPLIVTNDRGSRPCEKALNRDFARFDAGAHPSSTSRPGFSPEPRGARIAASLGLDIDPTSSAERRAIEVYPHPATVAIFRLGRTLKYKNKSGRPLERLKHDLLRLISLLEGLATAEVPLSLDHDHWRTVVERASSATRKSELRVAEDQVDAVVCAYVALLTERRPRDVTTYGDATTGYIVTPTLPAGHRPSAREPERHAPDRGPVHHAVQVYAAQHAELAETTEHVVALVTRLLDDAGINYLSVSGRTKSVASFATKANRTSGGRPVFTDPLREITDQIGLRVITYVHSDVAAVADLLADQLTVLDDRDMGRETAEEGRWGYASRHLLVTAPDHGDQVSGHEVLREKQAQVQLRTVLQHAWAEFEHDIRYKGTIPEEQAPDLDRRFTLAAGLLELADREFSTIRDRLRAGTAAQPDVDPDDPRISPPALASFLASHYSDAEWSRSDHYSWISGLLLELGVTSLEELGGLLTSVDSAAINARLGYRYPPGAVRRLDDALLAVFGERYLGLHGNSHRGELLQARLAKLRAPADPG
ncbi:DUF429 domain-containing protein [Aeromicrobium sp. CTD01-1L150]|uniref:DUF429 domain-containing protein n=1 Tax=Aeromicrobium sp. CTD01-1L150 TaxID=3341830 RepID=UPI0035C090C8